MAFNKRKILRNICLGLYFFLSGVEYAVILPTLNGFLISMNAETVFLGIVLSAFSFSGLIVAPIYGRITDRRRSAKLCVIIGNLFEIFGNFVYFISSNKYMVLGSRLIAGVGSGASSSIFGQISRTTTTEERTAVFSQFMALRQIGLIIGPAFNVFLSKLNFKIGPFAVDPFTSPGLLMAVIWVLHTILLIFAYKEPTNDVSIVNQTANGSGFPNHNYEEIGGTGRSSVLAGKKVKSFLNEFLQEQVVVCLAITFMIMFSQTGLEAAVTPMTLLFFDWSGLDNSILFCGAGFIVIFSFLLITLLSKRLSDRALMLLGCVGMLLTFIVFLSYSIVLYVQHDNETPNWLLPLFCLDIGLLTLSLPFVWVPQASLFSKITSEETQAFNQGIRLVAMGLGQIIGPIWASAMATEDRLPIMVGVDLALMILITSMVCMSYKYLVSPPESTEINSSTEIIEVETDEKTPLLNISPNEVINA